MHGVLVQRREHISEVEYVLMSHATSICFLHSRSRSVCSLTSECLFVEGDNASVDHGVIAM